MSTHNLEGLRNENVFSLSTPTVRLMVSVVHAILRRVEIGAWIEDRVKDGYNKGSWQHIKQSDKVVMKAWKAKS